MRPQADGGDSPGQVFPIPWLVNKKLTLEMEEVVEEFDSELVGRDQEGLKLEVEIGINPLVGVDRGWDQEGLLTNDSRMDLTEVLQQLALALGMIRSRLGHDFAKNLEMKPC